MMQVSSLRAEDTFHRECAKQVVTRNVALQSVDRFVARTTNWLYDHLRHVRRYSLVVTCKQLQNRCEFPELRARQIKKRSLSRRMWRRLTGDNLLPTDRWALRALKASVLHSHFGFIGLQDLELKRALDIPWIVSFYGADAYQKRERSADRYAEVFAAADRILALGPVMSQQLEKLGCPPEKLIVHPLGVLSDELAQKPRQRQPDEPLRILFAGTMREKKGIPYLLDGIAIARRAGVRLKLMLVGDAAKKSGDAETKEEVLLRIARLGLEDVVERRSYLPFDELCRLAMQCHVFAAPSVTAANGDCEGTPFVLQQMMAMAMPVIATDHTDIPFIFGQGLRHLLVPERNAQAIANALQRYYEHPADMQSDGTAMAERIRTAFDCRQRVTQLCNIYDACGERAIAT